jgi:hypothetical protein
MFSCRSHPKSSQTRFPDRRSRPARPHQLDRLTCNMGPVLARRKRAQIFGQTRPAAGRFRTRRSCRRLINRVGFDKTKLPADSGFHGGPAASTGSTGSANFYCSTSEFTAFDLIGTWFSRMARRATMLANPKTKKARPQRPGFLFSGGGRLVGGCRGELRDEAFERLVSLLGEIGVKPSDLLRLGHEGLISGLREFGLHFNRLVQGLHAGQLLDE